MSTRIKQQSLCQKNKAPMPAHGVRKDDAGQREKRKKRQKKDGTGVRVFYTLL